MVLSILIGVYFYGIMPERYDSNFLLVFALVPFLMFATGVHGLLSHLLTPALKDKMLVYPLVMGIVFTLLFFIHVFVVLPLVCPGCMGGFKY